MPQAAPEVAAPTWRDRLREAISGASTRSEREPAAHVVAPPAEEGSLSGTLASLEALQGILDDEPALLDRAAAGEAFIDALTERVDAHVVLIWTLEGEERLAGLVCRGAPDVVLSRGPAEDQPLIADALSSGATLESRVASGQSRLEGLPGMRGDTVLCSPISATGEHIGVVVIYGDGLGEEDLAAVTELVAEHGPRLAIATHLEILELRREFARDEGVTGDQLP